MHDPPRHSDFTREALTADGYRGWVVFTELRPGGSAVVEPDPGTYVVYRSTAGDPGFLTANPAGRFKNRDPTVGLDALEANWVDGAHVLYIGKADSLTVRVRAMAAFADGVRTGHWGGRLAWQLADASEFLFAWRPLREGFPTALADETEMVGLFRRAYGRSPFANNPDRLGR